MATQDRGERPNGFGEKLERRRFVLDETRLTILHQILAQPDGVLSVEELVYRNPETSEENLRYHLRQLVDRNVVEKVPVPRSQSIDDPPTTFYAVTGDGIALLKAVSMYEEAAVWRSVYEQMERTDRIEAIEDLETRPDVDYESRGATAED
ncbi:helix-turn-helix domain-containing protein [Halomicrobium sp. LC1Hm]|uniref:winged helix-turn-helix domain-containing protein n=1 Tax=Halomicrobium sp. LC1Hm TaxID=2610902 RepID=UPI0012983E66|nr:helix-turn-helix domain-containing protein [Halomicrobium sp. LC1Hm]QGA83538.1 ArsR family transcriptional regulator [Halomicrobium sp. LC1Hm]